MIQRIADAIGARSYLEIGVRRGSTFLPIRVRRKVAVDPSFDLSLGRRVRGWLRNPRNLFASYHETTSDAFFATSDERFDVVFVDGLHTYDQSRADVAHALERLRPGGVVVVHDCSPPTAAAAAPSPPPGGDALWYGEVWKTIVALRAERDDVRAWVLDCDTGLGIVTRERRDDPLDLGGAAVGALTFADLDADRERLLGLRPPEALAAFLARVA